jgi:hypothetical protein
MFYNKFVQCATLRAHDSAINSIVQLGGNNIVSCTMSGKAIVWTAERLVNYRQTGESM